MPRPLESASEPVRYVVIQRPPRGEARLLPPLLILLVASGLIVYRTLSPDWHWDGPPLAAAPPEAPIPKSRVALKPVLPAEPKLVEARPSAPASAPAPEPVPVPEPPAPPVIVAEPPRPEPDAVAHAARDDIRREAARRKAERVEAERVQEQEVARLADQERQNALERAARRRMHAPLDAQRAETHRQFDELIREHQQEQREQMREVLRLQAELFKEIDRVAGGRGAPARRGLPAPQGFTYAAPPGSIVRYQFRWNAPR